MRKLPPKHHLRSAHWLHIILGLCVLLSPFLVGFSNVPGFSDEPAMKWNNIVTGLVVQLLAAREGGPHRTGSVLIALLGGWLVTSPFVLGVSSPMPFWSNVILGIAIFITALVAATHRPDGPSTAR
jgi:hypothetical protein